LEPNPVEFAFLGVDQDPLVQQCGVIEPADGGELQETVLVDVLDHEADFVHVGGKHHRGLSLAFPGDEVAQAVGCDLVAALLELGFHDLAHVFLGAGDPVGL